MSEEYTEAFDAIFQDSYSRCKHLLLHFYDVLLKIENQESIEKIQLRNIFIDTDSEDIEISELESKQLTPKDRKFFSRSRSRNRKKERSNQAEEQSKLSDEFIKKKENFRNILKQLLLNNYQQGKKLDDIDQKIKYRMQYISRSE